MSDINQQLGIQVRLDQARQRETQKTDIGTKFRLGVATTTSTVGNALSIISPTGASVLFAAAAQVNGNGAGGGVVGGSGNVTTTDALGMGTGGALLGSAGSGTVTAGLTGGTATGGYMGAVAGRAAAGDASSQMMMATQQMQEMNQNFNLMYLNLQQKMQNENRSYTALSNVIKTKHDTAKNALSNLK